MFRKIFQPKNSGSKIKKAIQEEMRTNSSVLKSLKEYDEGKKEISTTQLQKRLPNIRTAG